MKNLPKQMDIAEAEQAVGLFYARSAPHTNDASAENSGSAAGNAKRKPPLVDPHDDPDFLRTGPRQDGGRWQFDELRGVSGDDKEQSHVWLGQRDLRA